VSRAVRVFHLAEAANWPAIRREGLLSAQTLLARPGMSQEIRKHRPQSLHLPGGVLVRDQSPMPPGALARCLDPGLAPADWYALINGMVFFWFDLDRLNRQRRACGRPQVAMAIDLARLIAAHGPRASVSPFNTGNARRQPASRGLRTFVPYDDFVADGWAREAAPGKAPRARGHAPVELTIADAVPDVMRFVLDAVTLAPGEAWNGELSRRRSVAR